MERGEQHGTHLHQPEQVRPGPRRARPPRQLCQGVRRARARRHLRGRPAPLRRRHLDQPVRGRRGLHLRQLQRRVLPGGDRPPRRGLPRGRHRRRRGRGRRQDLRHRQGRRRSGGRARGDRPHDRGDRRPVLGALRHLHRRRPVQGVPVLQEQPQPRAHGHRRHLQEPGAPDGLRHGRCAGHLLRGSRLHALRRHHLRRRPRDRGRDGARPALLRDAHLRRPQGQARAGGRRLHRVGREDHRGQHPALRPGL